MKDTKLGPEPEYGSEVVVEGADKGLLVPEELDSGRLSVGAAVDTAVDTAGVLETLPVGPAWLFLIESKEEPGFDTVPAPLDWRPHPDYRLVARESLAFAPTTSECWAQHLHMGHNRTFLFPSSLRIRFGSCRPLVGSYYRDSRLI